MLINLCRAWTYLLDFLAYGTAHVPPQQSEKSSTENNSTENLGWWKVVTDLEENYEYKCHVPILPFRGYQWPVCIRSHQPFDQNNSTYSRYSTDIHQRGIVWRWAEMNCTKTYMGSGTSETPNCNFGQIEFTITACNIPARTHVFSEDTRRTYCV